MPIPTYTDKVAKSSVLTFTKPGLNTSKLSDEYTIAASILPGSELPFRIPLIPFVVRRGDQSTKFARNFSN